MLGFLSPHMASLKKEERDLYRQYFCSLCVALTGKYGLMGPFLNNYEGVFALIFLSALGNEKEEILEVRCPVMPVNKRKVYRSDRQLKVLLSLMTMIITEKLRDDIRDDGSFIAGIFYRLMYKNYLKSREDLKEAGFPVERLDIRKEEQNSVERQDFISINFSSAPFASSVSDLFDYMGKNSLSSRKRTGLAGIGYQVGKFIYIYDAFRDYPKDIGKKRFNAISAGYPHQGNERGLISGVRGDIKKHLTFCAVDIRAKLDELPLGQKRRLIENILFDSLMKKLERI